MRENERASAVTRRHVRTANDPGSLGGRQTVGAFALRTCRKRTNERTNERMTEENLPTSCHKKGRAPEEKRSAEKGRRGFIHPSIGRRSDALFAFIFQSVASSFALRLTYCGSYGFHPERTDGQQTSERAINRSQRASERRRKARGGLAGGLPGLPPPPRPRLGTSDYTTDYCKVKGSTMQPPRRRISLSPELRYNVGSRSNRGNIPAGQARLLCGRPGHHNAIVRGNEASPLNSYRCPYPEYLSSLKTQ